MKDELRQLIAEGKTKETIQELLAITQRLGDQALYEEVILQSSKFEDYDRSKRLGMTNRENLQISKVQINNGLLRIINSLPTNGVVTDSKPEMVGGKPNRLKQRLLVVGGILALLIVIVEFLGPNIQELLRAGTVVKTVDVRVQLHGPRGYQDILLENQGKLSFSLSGTPYEVEVGAGGLAIFRSVPIEESGEQLRFFLNADKFKLVEAKEFTLSSEKTTYYLEVAKTAVGERSTDPPKEEKEESRTIEERKDKTSGTNSSESNKKNVQKPSSEPEQDEGKESEPIVKPPPAEPQFATIRCLTAGQGGIKVWFYDEHGEKYEETTVAGQTDLAFKVPASMVGQLIKVHFKKSDFSDHREQMFSPQQPFEIPLSVRNRN